jgi:hydrogenase maturation protease
MSTDALVIGIGNDFRSDDGVGLTVAAEIARRVSGVGVMTAIGEPATILEAWSGIPLVIAVDAAMGDGATPGRIRRWTPGDSEQPTVVSSHALGLSQTYALGQALGRIPHKLVVFTVDVEDIGHGVTLTPAVAAAVPAAVEAILTELQTSHRGRVETTSRQVVPAVSRRARSESACATASSLPTPTKPCSAGLSRESPTPTDS